MIGQNEPLPEEAPADPAEVVLAEAFDQALDLLALGEAVSAAGLLGGHPDLIGRGECLLAEANAVLAAVGAVQEQARLLHSDVMDLAGEESIIDAKGVAAQPAPALPPGEFVFRRPLGRGSFGVVWLAEDVHLGRPVAIKTIHQPVAGEAAARSLTCLREEARLLAAVRHRNVVQVYAWREVPGPPGAEGTPQHCLILQYVSGGSLAERGRQEGPLPWQRAARYIADVAEGLLEVHARGIVHRDIKPANILLDPEADEALLTDFGISTRLSDPGSVAGTPLFMSPEASQGRISPGQDVYGLAASLFWLVTGSVPFPGQTREEIAALALQGLPDPDPRCVGLPAPLERLIRSGLTNDPERRPALRDFAVALRGSLNQLLADSLLLPPSTPSRSPVHLRLTVSRQVDHHTFLPVATTQPAAEGVLRDLRRVPPQPERVEVRTGDRVRLEVETDRAGFVTVFNVGPTGNLNLLYPAADAPHAEPAAVERGRPLHVLDVELSPPAGRERLFALWTREPLPLRREELVGLALQEERPVSEPYRATRDMVRVQESVQRLEPADSQVVVLELNHLAALEDGR